MSMQKRVKSTSGFEQDRIPELPEPIIHHIFSFLPPIDAMATAVLSRAWREVWLTQPCLYLGKTLFHQKLQKKRGVGLTFTLDQTIRKQLGNQFLDFVDQTLTKRSVSYVQRLHLYVPKITLTREVCARLDRWINHAFSNYQLSELTFEFGDSYSEVLYEFPTKAFATAYYSLKHLSLSRVKLCSEALMEQLATNCPLLEMLCFYFCSHPSTLKVSGLLKLAEFVVKQDWYSSYKIEIDAPSLLVFDYKGCGSADHNVIHLVGCDKLKCLRISSLWSVVLESNPGIFSNLESLELGGSVDFITEFPISSKHLKSLLLGFMFRCCPSYLKLDAPNLKEFTSCGLAEACACLPHTWEDVQVVDFLAKFNACENLEIHTNLCQVFPNL